MGTLDNIYACVTSADEAGEVIRAYRKLINTYLASNHRRRVEVIERTFNLALTAHRGMRRHSGEPYIMHPLAVAEIVAGELGLGSTSICAALLHDVPEHTDYTSDDIAAVAGRKVADIVDAITRISGGLLTGTDLSSSGDYRSLLLSMREDVRVIVVKMAERLHNMRTLGFERPEKQLRTARETLFVYAPLAERLGLFSLKSELEDLAFSYLYPDDNAKIQETLSRTADRRNRIVADFMAPVRIKLDRLGIKYEVKARVKSAYSIFNKMRKKKIPLEEIYDIYAVRVIFENENPEEERMMCWQIYTCFTDIYKTHPDRLRDWTSTPKSNGYRALHLTCMGPAGEWVEVQIRSRQMDDLAELGCAAHWKYKTHDNSIPELDSWMETIRNVLAKPDADGMDTLDHIRLGLCAHEIFVFTHRGELMRMPAGSTVADMAARISPAARCLGAKVNHRLVPAGHILASGDRVELLTSTQN